MKYISFIRNLSIFKTLKAEENEGSEIFFREIFEKSGDALLIIKNNIFIDCNIATLNMLKFKTKESFLNTHPSFLSPKLQPDGKNSFKKAEEMMKTCLEKGTHRFEWIHTKNSGANFLVEVLLTTINNEPNNEIIHCVWRDITQRKESEAKLLKLNTAINNSINEVYIFDSTSLNFSYSNKRAIQNLGYSYEDLKKMTPLDLKPKYNYKSFTKMLAPLKKGIINNLKFETTHQRKDKTLYPVEVNLSVFEDNNLQFLALIIDLTKQRKEEQIRLKEIEIVNNFLQESQSIANLGYYTYDFKTKYWKASKTILDIIGLKDRKGDLQSWIDIIHPEDRIILTTVLKKRKKGALAPFDITYRLIRPKDNKISWIRHKVKDLKLDSDKKTLPTFGIIQDVTNLIELKRSKQELEYIVTQRNQELSQEKIFSDTIINNIPGIFSLTDLDGKYIRWNKNHEKITGYSRKEYEQLTILDFFSSSSLSKIKKHFKQLKINNKVDFESNIKTKEGKEIPFFLSVLKIAIKDKVFIAASGIDISKHKETEAKFIKQTKELAVFNEIMIDREMRIIEMKEEINKLSKQFKQDPPYPTVWDKEEEF